MKKIFIAFLLICGMLLTATIIRAEEQQNTGISQNSEPTKIGIIVETKDAEKAWNAFRFAIAAKNNGCEVKVFLMGEGVECETVNEKTFNVGEKMTEFVKAGGEIFACGTCLKSRQMNGTDVCPMSNMKTCVEIVLWADKMLTF